MNPKKEKSALLRGIDEFFDVAIAFGKAQLIISAINFAVVTAGLLILGKGWWAPLIALGISVVDILPVLGSGAVFIPWIIYSVWAHQGSFALGLGIIYVIMIALRFIVEPIICGKKIGLSPLIAVAAAIAGLAFMGGIGLILGPLIASCANIVYRIYAHTNKKKDNDNNNSTSV